MNHLPIKANGGHSPPKSKGKRLCPLNCQGDVHPKTKKSGFNNQEFKFPPKQYSFKDEQVIAIFHLLHKGNKLKLSDARRPNEVGRTNDPDYCLFHRMVHHPTNKCFVLKEKIQALVDAEVLTLKSEQKKVTANMVTPQVRRSPKSHST